MERRRGDKEKRLVEDGLDPAPWNLDKRDNPGHRNPCPDMHE